ncbi:hypothetical protein E0W69_005820 [Rhizosphaericola mali]|uniref:Uncharacterized protein n=2 Tax=Rhizosphaericola mali TaxID=2545455 RepID=A0A5P2FXF8_9BACT|nr:hypothetical protein E0W69_005820 [Rhizosphaericola mali]
MQMKKIILPAFLLLTTINHAKSQTNTIAADSINDKNIRTKVLSEIQSGFESRTRMLDSTVEKLDARVSYLDKSILDTKDSKEKSEKLILRVQAIEDKQKTIDQTELNLLQANYQSAFVNLVSMDREIKPLVLFNSTKTFFSSLSDAGNPMNYDGYTKWYKGFSDYLQAEKSKSPLLSVTSNLIGFANGFTKGVPITGPITTALFTGMNSYIDNMGKKEKDLKAQSEQMLTLTMKISQFDYDKDQIEHEWESIAKELQELQTKYDKTLTTNLKMVGVDKVAFQRDFSAENDAEMRYQYLTNLRDKAAKCVADERQNNPKDWKQSTFVQMGDVQNLRLRFGQITLRISQNIVKYKELFDKYQNDPQLGSKIKDLQFKLKDLQESFDKTFDPMDYINSANKMYKI